MKRKMDPESKLMAYVLSTDADFNRNMAITQSTIANIFGVAQSTVAQSIKEVKLSLMDKEQEQINQELTKAKEDVRQLKNIESLQFPDDICMQYKRKL